MSTIEKLFVQIFETKQRMLDQVKQQIDSYDRLCASKLLIQGIRPPPWLLDSALHSQISDSKDMKKEELIPGILLTRPQSFSSFSTHHSLYNGPIVSEGAEECSDGLMENRDAANNSFDADAAFNIAHRSTQGDATLVADDIPNAVSGGSSPHGVTIPNYSEICPDLEKSLARFQRSRPRQRAVEIRSSAKVKSKGFPTSDHVRNVELNRTCGINCSWHEFNHVDTSFTLREQFRASDPGKIEPRDGSEKRQKANSTSKVIKPTSSLRQVVSGDYGLKTDCLPHMLIESGRLLGKPSLVVPDSIEVRRSSIRNSGSNRKSETFRTKIAAPSHKKSGHKNLFSNMKNYFDLSNLDDRAASKNVGESTRQTSSAVSLPSTSDISEGIAGKQEVVEATYQNVENNNIFKGSGTSNLSHVSVEGSDTQDFMGNLSMLSPVLTSVRDDAHDGVAPSSQISAERCSLRKDNVENIPINQYIDTTFRSQTKGEVLNSSNSLMPRRVSRSESSSKPQGTVGSLNILDMPGNQMTTRPHSEIISDAQERSSDSRDLKIAKNPGALAIDHLAVDLHKNDVRKVSSGTKLSMPSCNYLFSVKPKQLNFDDDDEYNPMFSSSECSSKGQVEASESVVLEPVELHGVVSDSSCGTHNQSLGFIFEGNDVGKLEASKDLSLVRATEVDVEMDVSPSDIHVHSSEPNEIICGDLGMKDKNCENTIIQTMIENEEIFKQLPSPLKLSALSNYSVECLPKEVENCVVSDGDEFMNLRSFAGSEVEVDELDTSKVVSENIGLNIDIIPGPRKQREEDLRSAISGFLTSQSIPPNDQIITSTSSDNKNKSAGNDSSCNTASCISPGALSFDKADVICSKTTDMPVFETSMKRKRAALSVDGSWLQHKQSKTGCGLDTNFSSSFLPLSPKYKEVDFCCTSSISREDIRDVDMDVSALVKKSSDKESPIISDNLFSCIPLEPHLESNIRDQSMPVFEGFLTQTGGVDGSILEDELSFEALSAVERASILEQLYKSATCTPIPQFHDTCKLLGEQDTINSRCSGAFCDNLSVPIAHPSLEMGKICTSPVTKLWDGMSFKLNSDSSGKRKSSNPELTCFPIKEEESSNVEDAMDIYRESLNLISFAKFSEGKPLDDMKEAPNHSASISEVDLFFERASMASVNTEITVSHTKDQARHRPGKQESSKKMHRYVGKENKKVSVCSNGNSSANQSLRRKVYAQKLSGKASLKNKGQILSERDPKKDNIVFNVSSFVPLVQQKQAAAAFTGKRDIKVKALEAAEAAKRLEEQREHERKMKKDALKLERARLDEQRQLNQMKKQVGDQNRKDTDAGTRKRVREVQEKMDKERKRKHIQEARAPQRDDQISRNAYKTENKALMTKLSETSQNEAALSLAREQSYDLSPYHGSNDEDEPDDNVRTRKYIPSWASKSRLNEVLSLQHGMDRLKIFPKESFCSIIDVVSGL